MYLIDNFIYKICIKFSALREKNILFGENSANFIFFILFSFNFNIKLTNFLFGVIFYRATIFLKQFGGLR